jgi:lipopolysaccharide biosynthesis glycosyltransferase
LAVYDPQGTYSRHAGVLMTSIFEHTQSPVCIHVLHDNTLTADNRGRFSRTAERFNQKVRFVDVTNSFSKIDQDGDMDKIAKRYTRGMFFRLLIPDLIDAEKVIYMDCDIVVNLDIAELWNIDLSVPDVSLAAVADEVLATNLSKIERTRFDAWGLEYGKYFNSGVLLMDLNRMRQKYNDLLRGVKLFYERYGALAVYIDQDFLNVTFRNDVLFIDGRFNKLTMLSLCEGHAKDIEGVIIHFAGPKPWVFLKNSASDSLYWEMFERSEWSDQLREQLFGVLKNLCHDGECRCKYHRGSECVRHVTRRLLNRFRLVFTRSLPVWFRLCGIYLSKLRRRPRGETI